MDRQESIEDLTFPSLELYVDEVDDSNDLSRTPFSNNPFEMNTEICHSTPNPPTGNLPSLEEFAGPHDFQVKLSKNGPNRSSWVHSNSLDQVFIDMQKILLVQFHLKSNAPGMSVRALPVFSSSDFIGSPVLRCPFHALEDDPSGKAHQQDGECLCFEYNLAGHVVRVATIQAKYCFDAFSKRHSVVVPVTEPQPGSEFTEVPYMFMCKTSCSRGMNRRPIMLVFTLEDKNGLVVGRRVMSIKVCSCPKRDKERLEKERKEMTTFLAVGDENTHSKKRTGDLNFVFPGHKRIKHEDYPEKEDLKARMQQIIEEIKNNIAYTDRKIQELEFLFKK